jgi:reactive intermediate/imine deaminase
MRGIHAENAPRSIGPFSQAIEDGDRIYVSGQGPIDPASGEIVEGDVAARTARTLENVDAIIQAAGCSLDDVVETTVFVRDVDDYDAVDGVYGESLSEPYPARSAVEIARRQVGIDVEIQAVGTTANR